MSVNPDPSASRLAVIRRPKEYCSESTEDENGKEKGLRGSVRPDGLTEEGEELQEAVPCVRRKQQGSLLSVLFVGGHMTDTGERGDRVVKRRMVRRGAGFLTP